MNTVTTTGTTQARQPNARKTTTGIKVRTQTGPNMLQAALWYAARGWHVFPLHAPIFDAGGDCVGCTCEAWKRTQARYGPDYKCPQPGKCPAVRWAEKSTTDPAQIRKWFGHPWKAGAVSFTPNIGIDCGKSVLLAFDADAYKETYGGDDLLSLADKQTVTSLTGGGGEHLIYTMPKGKAYGNAKGELPAGIDIRGAGGYIVAPPSLHKSGRRYQFEDGYNPVEIALQAIPDALRTILDTAQQTRIVQAVTFAQAATEKPGLLQWRTSPAIRELINNPAPAGQRSEADMKVVTSLCYAGATDDQILAVFEHYPIGQQGKFAEAGHPYLAHTIAKARGFAELHPRLDVDATINHVRLWIRTHSFEDHIPAALRTDVYRTDSTDTKVADAILDVMQESRRLSVNVGKKRLAKLAGMSCNTALKALTRLAGWLFDVTPSTTGALVALVENSRLQQIDPFISVIGMPQRDQSSENDSKPSEINLYSPHKAAEPFLMGMSNYVREQIQSMARTLEIPPAQVKADYTFASFGEAGIRVLDALARCSDMTAAELASETGKRISAIRTACKKLIAHGALEGEREGANGVKVYSLTPDYWSKVAEIAPHLRTNKLADQRENKRLKDGQLWAQRGQKAAQTPEEKLKFERRFAKLARQRLPHLASLYAHRAFTQEDLARLAFEVNTPAGLHPAVQRKLDHLHGNARMDLAEGRRKEQWETTRLLRENIAALKASDTPKRDWYDMLTMAGFTQSEAKRAIAVGGA